MQWVLPTGLVGLGPLAAAGPVSVGPGSVERSSVNLPGVTLHLETIKSILQRKVCQLCCPSPACPHLHCSCPGRRGKARRLQCIGLRASALPYFHVSSCTSAGSAAFQEIAG